MNIVPPMPSPERAFKVYQPLVEGNPQAVPIVLWANAARGLQVIQVVPPPDWPPEAAMADLYEPTLAAAAEMLGRPAWIVISAEMWVRSVPEAEVEGIRHGDLEKAALAGDESVGEAVFIAAVGQHEEWCYQRRFRRTANRVRWDDTPLCVPQALGGMADLQRRFVREAG